MTGIKINRLTGDSDKNGSYTIIAAIPTKDSVNGHTIYSVTGYDEGRRQYVTWKMGWNYSDLDEHTRGYTKVYDSGHYRTYSLFQPDARELALADMVSRAGLPAPVTSETVASETSASENADVSPHELQPMAGWEVSLRWPAGYACGIYYLTQGQMLTIYDMIRHGRIIQAIATWREASGTKTENGTTSPVLGLLEAKNAVRAVKAHFRNILAESGAEVTEGCGAGSCAFCYPQHHSG